MLNKLKHTRMLLFTGLKEAFETMSRHLPETL
jgi:hypothetical protein